MTYAAIGGWAAFGLASIALAVLALRRAGLIEERDQQKARAVAAANHAEALAAQLHALTSEITEVRLRSSAELRSLRAELSFCVARFDNLSDTDLLSELIRLTTPNGKP
jgi:hypothetical protein